MDVCVHALVPAPIISITETCSEQDRAEDLVYDGCNGERGEQIFKHDKA